jgi:hypothetical protein
MSVTSISILLSAIGIASDNLLVAGSNGTLYSFRREPELLCYRNTLIKSGQMTVFDLKKASFFIINFLLPCLCWFGVPLLISNKYDLRLYLTPLILVFIVIGLVLGISDKTKYIKWLNYVGTTCFELRLILLLKL